MSLFSGILGLGKLASNFIGGGAGSSSSTNQNQNSIQTQQLSGSTTGQSATTQVQSQKADQQQFSDAFLQLLEGVSADALGSSAQGASSLRDQMTTVQGGLPANNFDVDAYVRGITKQANDTIQDKLGSDTNAIAAATGGSTKGNSQSALLKGRLDTQAANDLAGITQSATASGQQIKSGIDVANSGIQTQQSQQLAGLSETINSSLAQLLSSLKGGETFQTSATNGQSQTNEAQNTSQSSVTNTTGTTTQNTDTPFNWSKGFGSIFNNINTAA